jgi:hypothetical protein
MIYPLKRLLKLIAYALGYFAMLATVVLLLALFVVNPDAEQENAAYHAVLDYASNKSTRLPPVDLAAGVGDPDNTMITKPFESESCPGRTKVLGLRWVRSHPCWIVEYPTSFNTYRWFVDLRDPQRVRRRGLDHEKPVWVEIYEYKVKRLPPFDSFYPQSEDWNK